MKKVTSHLFFFCSFFGHQPHLFEMTEKKLSQFDHNVIKYGLVDTVTVTFNTIMGQMTTIP